MSFKTDILSRKGFPQPVDDDGTAGDLWEYNKFQIKIWGKKKKIIKEK